MKYEHVFLDVGNVLFHDWAVEMVYSYLAFDGLNAAGQDHFWQARLRELGKGNMDWVVTVCREYDPENEPRLIRQAWQFVLDHWQQINVPVENALEALRRLSRHVPVSVAANQPAQTRSLLEAYGVPACVDQIILDAELGLRKPQRAFFEKLLALTHTPAEKALYVGDRIENDILPAKAVGMDTAWINYTPSFQYLEFVPTWWQDLFFESYRKIGGYNLCSRQPGMKTQTGYGDLRMLCDTMGWT